MFADRGYHGARVGDIAEDAGVAHGLLYHYFASKDDVLRTIFVENWGALIARFRAVEASAEPAPEKLEGIAKILLRTWRNDPALVTVMVREVARGSIGVEPAVDRGPALGLNNYIYQAKCGARRGGSPTARARRPPPNRAPQRRSW